MDTHVTDALHRLCRGTASWDRELLASALTADAELDPRRSAAAWSAHGPRLIGRDTIADILLGIVRGRVDTTHAITESSVTFDGGRARLRALVDIRHRLIADHSVEAHLVYRCIAEVVPADTRWALRRSEFETVHHSGDPTEIYCRAPVIRPRRPRTP
ncbi:nuclear transport factor 2 family protein [Nocardia spumae]|uniref:nuclear transport factor 2 family protein n=1 Tax=Nocardia spumae TaxID=2887190 RepID=UPI001D1572F2|nr:nuclear transport factor 2 family protein [Nocardia spumae]